MKAALFDLDGVVFNTEPQYTVFWSEIFKEYFNDAMIAQKIKGSTLVQIYDHYFAGDKKTQDEITRRLDDFEQHMHFDYIKGFPEYVTGLRQKGVKTAVVTSSNKAKMAAVYAKCPEMKQYFDAILTSEDFAESKPSPDCYLKGAERFGVSPDECVVLEDSINGLKSGRAAGMYVVGLTTTNTKENIEALSNIQIKDYQDINYQKLNTLWQDI